MSAKYYDLLKYAATGIASPGMTYYDKMRALAMTGGGKIKTLTGIPPLSFKANGKPLISWSMLGNAQQTGTPSPDNIIMPDFCGVRTGNLFDYQTMANGVAGKFLDETGTENRSSAWMITDYIPVNGTVFTVGKLGGDAPAICLYDANKVLIAGKKYATGRVANKSDITITTSAEAKYVRFSWYSGNDSNRDDISALMLNSGSIALPYEPYGYEIPITCAGQTVPVYLGQTQTVRRIRKLVLTGEELWIIYNTNYWSNVTDNDSMQPGTCVCSHLPSASNTGIYIGRGLSRLKVFSSSVSSVASNLDEWKQYLRDQYSAGTPVTVWYVLAEPETAIVNEPLCKIGDYADELHSTDAGVTIPTTKGNNTLTVNTDLQPSGVTIRYKADE